MGTHRILCIATGLILLAIANAGHGQDTIEAEIQRTSTPPTIDGIADEQI